MTVIVGAGGLVLYPDWPDRPNRWAFWLTKRDKEIAAERLDRTHRVSPNPVTWKTMKRVLLNPIMWMMVCIYVSMLIAPSGNACESLDRGQLRSATYCPVFNLWLRSLTNPDGSKVWSVNSLNAIPIAGFALQSTS